MLQILCFEIRAGFNVGSIFISLGLSFLLSWLFNNGIKSGIAFLSIVVWLVVRLVRAIHKLFRIRRYLQVRQSFRRVLRFLRLNGIFLS